MLALRNNSSTLATLPKFGSMGAKMALIAREMDVNPTKRDEVKKGRCINATIIVANSFAMPPGKKDMVQVYVTGTIEEIEIPSLKNCSTVTYASDGTVISCSPAPMIKGEEFYDYIPEESEHMASYKATERNTLMLGKSFTFSVLESAIDGQLPVLGGTPVRVTASFRVTMGNDGNFWLGCTSIVKSGMSSLGPLAYRQCYLDTRKDPFLSQSAYLVDVAPALAKPDSKGNRKWRWDGMPMVMTLSGAEDSIYSITDTHAYVNKSEDAHKTNRVQHQLFDAGVAFSGSGGEETTVPAKISDLLGYTSYEKDSVGSGVCMSMACEWAWWANPETTFGIHGLPPHIVRNILMDRNFRQFTYLFVTTYGMAKEDSTFPSPYIPPNGLTRSYQEDMGLELHSVAAPVGGAINSLTYEVASLFNAANKKLILIREGTKSELVVAARKKPHNTLAMSKAFFKKKEVVKYDRYETAMRDEFEKKVVGAAMMVCREVDFILEYEDAREKDAEKEAETKEKGAEDALFYAYDDIQTGDLVYAVLLDPAAGKDFDQDQIAELEEGKLGRKDFNRMVMSASDNSPCVVVLRVDNVAAMCLRMHKRLLHPYEMPNHLRASNPKDGLIVRPEPLEGMNENDLVAAMDEGLPAPPTPKNEEKEEAPVLAPAQNSAPETPGLKKGEETFPVKEEKETLPPPLEGQNKRKRGDEGEGEDEGEPKAKRSKSRSRSSSRSSEVSV